MWAEPENLNYTSIEKIESFQNTALQKHLAYISNNSTFYKSLFAKNEIDPTSITRVEQIGELPVTTKEDLEGHNEDFLCVSKREIIEFVTTSGTLSNPIIIALTKGDLDRLAYNEKRSLEMAGIGPDDIIQITTTLDKMFMAGMAYYLGAIAIGATVVRSGIGNPRVQWENILRFKPTISITVPSFLNKLAGYGLQINMNPNHTSLKKAICIGEPLRNSDFSPNKLHQNISKNWDIQLFSTYASTEMMTAFTECEAKCGGHQLAELIIVEILDDEGNQVADGELGEVTVTPLMVEAMPLLRYKTGDLARAHTTKCSCGRTTLRIGPVEGRKKYMIKLKGTTIFPQAIENVLQSYQEIELHIIELENSTIDTDLVRLYLVDSISDDLYEKIKLHLKEKLRVSIDILRIPENELITMLFPLGSRKPLKIIDNRK